MVNIYSYLSTRLRPQMRLGHQRNFLIYHWSIWHI